MKTRKAWFLVSGILLKDALAFPKSLEILNIQRHDIMEDTFIFLIEDPSIPEREVEEGEQYPQIYPLFTADYEKKPSTWIECNLNPDRSVKS